MEITEGGLMSRGKYHDSVVGGMLGLATGDAFGVPVEFMSRKEVLGIQLENMEGCDTGIDFDSKWGLMIKAGTWSDDTSMTVAEVESIIANRGKIDFDDIMERFFDWWKFGDYSAIEGEPFGLGRCVKRSLDRYLKGYPALQCGGKDVRDNGNGSLMRIFPFSMFCIAKGFDDDKTASLIGLASGMTHGHDISKMGCFLYTRFLKRCLETGSTDIAYADLYRGKDFEEYYSRWYSDEAVKAYDGLWNIVPEEIPENGYVADSLKIALYSIVTTKSFESAVKTAVSFGYDTDTYAAITGSIAGALYGVNSIPARWISVLKRRKYLRQLSEKFASVL